MRLKIQARQEDVSGHPRAGARRRCNPESRHLELILLACSAADRGLSPALGVGQASRVSSRQRDCTTTLRTCQFRDDLALIVRGHDPPPRQSAPARDGARGVGRWILADLLLSAFTQLDTPRRRAPNSTRALALPSGQLAIDSSPPRPSRPGGNFRGSPMRTPGFSYRHRTTMDDRPPRAAFSQA